VQGDMDDDAFPEEAVVDVGEFKIGLIHGHQVVPWGDKRALSIAARRLGVDILISGHTHEHIIEEEDGVWLINPGSATGYYTPVSTGDAIKPTFICMSVMGNIITNYVYILDPETGEVTVKKDRLVKGDVAGGAGKTPSPRPAVAVAVAPPAKAKLDEDEEKDEAGGDHHGQETAAHLDGDQQTTTNDDDEKTPPPEDVVID
jgi:predicted phosphodiesterase